MELKGKRALVTGGAVRLGRAIVEALQEAGAEVVVHYRKSAKEAEALSSHTVQCDLSQPDQVASMLKKTGPLDLLVNNASIFSKDRLADATPDRVEQEFRINFFAPLQLLRQFAAQTQQGAVVNLLDRRIMANDPSCLPYSISKKALAELTRIAALELAPGIRVNGVAPGPILPPPGSSGEDFRERAGYIPLDLLPTPQHIAEAAIFLLKADYATGQIIYVDGGQHLLGNGV